MCDDDLEDGATATGESDSRDERRKEGVVEVSTEVEVVTADLAGVRRDTGAADFVGATMIGAALSTMIGSIGAAAAKIDVAAFFNLDADFFFISTSGSISLQSSSAMSISISISSAGACSISIDFVLLAFTFFSMIGAATMPVSGLLAATLVDLVDFEVVVVVEVLTPPPIEKLNEGIVGAGIDAAAVFFVRFSSDVALLVEVDEIGRFFVGLVEEVAEGAMIAVVEEEPSEKKLLKEVVGCFTTSTTSEGCCFFFFLAFFVGALFSSSSSYFRSFASSIAFSLSSLLDDAVFFFL